MEKKKRECENAFFFFQHIHIHAHTFCLRKTINREMETNNLTPEQIVMICVFVAIPLGLIGIIILFSFASCCGYQIAVISPNNNTNSRSVKRKRNGDGIDGDTSSSSSVVGYKHEYDEHEDESTDGDVEANVGAKMPPPPKRYSLIRFLSNLGNNHQTK